MAGNMENKQQLNRTFTPLSLLPLSILSPSSSSPTPSMIPQTHSGVRPRSASIFVPPPDFSLTNLGHKSVGAMTFSDDFLDTDNSTDVSMVPGRSEHIHHLSSDSVTLDDITTLDLSFIYNQEGESRTARSTPRFHTPTSFDPTCALPSDFYIDEYTDINHPGSIDVEPLSLEPTSFSPFGFPIIPSPLRYLSQDRDHYQERASSSSNVPVVPVVPTPLHHNVQEHIAVADNNSNSGSFMDSFDWSPEDARGPSRCESSDSAMSVSSSGAEAVVPVIAEAQQQHPMQDLLSPNDSSSPTTLIMATPTQTTRTQSLIDTMLPKVDKPELGDLTGKMPRPAVVNTAPRRRKKGELVSADDLRREDEERKLKSVLSARDCRKRKKQYILGLQKAIEQYDKREIAARRLVAKLRDDIAELKRG